MMICDTADPATGPTGEQLWCVELAFKNDESCIKNDEFCI